MRLGLGIPRGILEMGDDLGLDKLLESLNSFNAQHGTEDRKPSQLLVDLVKRNQLGRKTGRGFYDHGAAGGKFETILLETDPKTGVAWLTLNRPDRLNTITSTMMRELSNALDQLEQDDKVRVLVIKGAGQKAFSAGADISAFQGLSLSGMAAGSRRGHRVYDKVERFPRPVVAAIRGYCFGGGCELSMACDFRIASASSQIGLPEITLGIIPGWGGTQRMTRLLGVAKAKEMIMFGDRVGAEEAKRIGLVTRVVPDDAFDGEVEAFASRLASGPPIALELAKKSIATAGGLDAAGAGFEFEAQAAGIAAQTEDAAEGVASFLSKKKPEFKGR